MVNNCTLFYCKTPQCKMCRLGLLDEDPDFYSNLCLTKHSLSANGNCKSFNCIYLISCKAHNCHMKYIGFTTNPINKRLSGHRANLINGSEGKAMYNHFIKHHSVTDMIIKPIEFCDKSMLRVRERFWILELNTVFPYGLNDRVDWADIRDAQQHVLSNSPKPIYTLFNYIKNNRTKRGSGINKHNRDAGDVPFNPGIMLQHIINSTTVSIAKVTRQMIMALNLKQIRTLLIYISSQLLISEVIFEYNEHLLYMVQDICLYKLLYSHNIRMIKNNTNFIIVEFSNCIMNDINLSGIIQSTFISKLFPVNDILFSKPSISYKYSATIRAKVTNYQDVANNIHANHKCFCQDYEQFVDINHKHVITGDLDIIENSNIRSLLSKGLNYREQQPLNKESTFAVIQNAIDVYIDKVSTQLKISTTAFLPWKVELLSNIKCKIDEFKTYHLATILDNNINKSYLHSFQNKFVMVPVDKASNNISIICKSFYVQVLQQEVINSGNFNPVLLTKSSAIKLVINYMTKYNLYNPDNNNLPFLYWTPKMHKEPIEPRFITSGKNCVNSNLSATASVCLKALLNTERNYYNYIHKYDNI